MMTSYKDHLDLNNFDDDEDLTDDEVFTRGGKSIPLEENGVNKPLMAPRNRGRGDNLQTKVRKVPPCRVLWAPLLYGIIALSAIIGIICLIIFLINTFMIPLGLQRQLIVDHEKTLISCNNITVEDIWTQTFPMLTTETAIRMIDVNQDGIPDVIMGFGTGADSFNYPPVVCDVYFNNEKCGGGLLALDGSTGHELWRHYTLHEIFAVNCNIDINKDGVKDCLAGGRMAEFLAVNGRDGNLLWTFNDSQVKMKTSNFYTPVYIKDLDFDGVPDIVNIHGGDPLKKPGSADRLVGRILIISSRTGKVIHWVEVPDKKESYYSPQIHVQPDGTELILFGTGGETHGGSLWYIKLDDLLKGNIHMAKAVYTDNQKGVMTPPVIVDVNGDGINDIVMAMFNSTVIAFNGLNFQRLWVFHIPSSESYSTPGVGFFNNDSIPDFIINYQIGPGFPIYYYTETTILDGRNGKPLLDKPIRMVVGTQSSPLVISVEDIGNDIFLYWISDCHGDIQNKKLEYTFLQGINVHEQSRADFCKIRFKEKLFTKMYGLNSHMTPPGFTIYDSDSQKNIEYNSQLNYTAIGLAYLRKHPEHWSLYSSYAYNNVQEQSDNNQYLHLVENKNHHHPYKDHKYSPNNYMDDSFIEDVDNTNQRPYDPEDLSNQYQNAYYQKKYRNFDKNIPSNDYGYDYDNNEPNNENMRDWVDRSQNDNWNEWYNERNFLPNSKDQANFRKQRRRYHRTNGDVKNNILEKNSRKKKRQLEKNYEKIFNTERNRRHVGPHDGGGIQRTISTGALFPITDDGNNDGHSIDIIFATFWFYPAHTQVLLPDDVKCIQDRLAKESERFIPESKYHNMDTDTYEAAITKECLKSNGHYSEKNKSIYDSLYDYNPFNRPMGQMTVYRTRISCYCKKQNYTSDERCAKILPFEHQGWTAYMGQEGNCLYNPHLPT